MNEKNEKPFVKLSQRIYVDKATFRQLVLIGKEITHREGDEKFIKAGQVVKSLVDEHNNK